MIIKSQFDQIQVNFLCESCICVIFTCIFAINPPHPLQYESFANIYCTSNKKSELIIKHEHSVGVFDEDFKIGLGMKL